MLKSPIELLIASEETCVQNGGFFLKIRGRHLDALGNVATRITNDQTGIPQRMQHALGYHFEIGTRFVVVEEQKVDIRVWIQFSTSVPTACNTVWRCMGRGKGLNLL